MAGLSYKAALTASDSTRTDPGIYFRVNCTVAGDVKVETPGGSDTLTVAVGTSFFPVSVIRVYSTGTTATATYANYSR
jgi:hypothetical protein